MDFVGAPYREQSPIRGHCLVRPLFRYLMHRSYHHCLPIRHRPLHCNHQHYIQNNNDDDDLMMLSNSIRIINMTMITLIIIIRKQRRMMWKLHMMKKIIPS